MFGMKRSVFAIVLSLLMAAVALPSPAAAADPVHPLRLAAGGISLDQAVQMAQSRYNARVVRADTANEGNRIVYRLRLLSADGRVFSVRIDAQTGQFL